MFQLLRTPVLPMAMCFGLAASQIMPVLAQSTTIIVQEGNTLPGRSGSFLGFDPPALNDVGKVAFRATTSLGPGVFVGDEVTGLTEIALRGQPVPNGGTITGFFDLSFNNSNQASFMTFLERGSANRFIEAIFRGEPMTGLTEIVRTNEVTPDGNGRFWSVLSQVELNEVGQTAIRGISRSTGDGPRTQSAIFLSDDTSGLTEIVRTGQAVPGGNGEFAGIASSLALNDAGQVAFSATVRLADGVTFAAGIFLGDGVSHLTEIVRRGQAAPDGNGSISTVLYPSINSTGQVAFRARLSGTNSGSGDDQGIFLGDEMNGLLQIARKGDLAPDRNGTFIGFEKLVQVNNLGQAAFRGFLSGTSGETTDNSGLFRGDGVSDLLQIAREGSVVPDGNGSFSDFVDPAFNDAGQAAFRATLSNTSGGSVDDSGIYFYDDALGLLKVAREGDAFLNSTITSLGSSNFSSSGDEQSGLNELGQVAYSFKLADGNSGIAIWTAAIPEPSTFSLLAFASLLVVSRRHTKSNPCHI